MRAWMRTQTRLSTAATRSPLCPTPPAFYCCTHMRAQVWKGPMIAAGGYKRENAMQAVESGARPWGAAGCETTRVLCARALCAA